MLVPLDRAAEEDHLRRQHLRWGMNEKEMSVIGRSGEENPQWRS